LGGSLSFDFSPPRRAIFYLDRCSFGTHSRSMFVATAELKKGDVKDIALADAGKRKIEWAQQQMPVLQLIRKRFIKDQPLKGLRVSACLHVTSETANLMITLARWRRGRGAAAHPTHFPRRTKSPLR
jgi:hypothetical protein